MIKTSLLFIALISIFCLARRHAANPVKKDNRPRKGYLLSIDQDKIDGPRDTVIGGKNYVFALVPVELSNFTKDTLKYANMTCLWTIIFTINKNNVEFGPWICNRNFPAISIVAPQKSNTYHLPLFIEKQAFTDNYNFKIGIYLIKSNEGYHWSTPFEDIIKSGKWPANSLIWSNEVKMSK